MSITAGHPHIPRYEIPSTDVLTESWKSTTCPLGQGPWVPTLWHPFPAGKYSLPGGHGKGMQPIAIPVTCKIKKILILYFITLNLCLNFWSYITYGNIHAVYITGGARSPRIWPITCAISKPFYMAIFANAFRVFFSTMNWKTAIRLRYDELMTRWAGTNAACVQKVQNSVIIIQNVNRLIRTPYLQELVCRM